MRRRCSSLEFFSNLIYTQLVFTALLLVGPARCSADSVTVSVSGQFGSGVTADTMAAPGASWSLSFDIDIHPVAANPDIVGFDAPPSNFVYTVGGSPVAVSPDEIRFYTTAGGGLFTLFFGPETGFFNGMPIPEFTFSGNQAFSGTTTNPTILAGSYPLSDVLYSDSLNYDDQGASGAVTFAASSTTTSAPEPSTLRLSVLIAAALSVALLRTLRRSRAAQHVS